MMDWELPNISTCKLNYHYNYRVIQDSYNGKCVFTLIKGHLKSLKKKNCTFLVNFLASTLIIIINIKVNGGVCYLKTITKLPQSPSNLLLFLLAYKPKSLRGLLMLSSVPHLPFILQTLCSSLPSHLFTDSDCPCQNHHDLHVATYGQFFINICLTSHQLST